jgi:hypothetical protein
MVSAVSCFHTTRPASDVAAGSSAYLQSEGMVRDKDKVRRSLHPMLLPGQAHTCRVRVWLGINIGLSAACVRCCSWVTRMHAHTLACKHTYPRAPARKHAYTHLRPHTQTYRIMLFESPTTFSPFSGVWQSSWSHTLTECCLNRQRRSLTRLLPLQRRSESHLR